MAIDAAGWFDWAIRLPGPPKGQNGGRNGGKGMIPHSAVGTWDSAADLLSFLTARVNAPPKERSSWGATNMQDGTFYQHYSIWAQTWTSGSGYPNNNFFAFENEGGGYLNGKPNFSEPLTIPQIDNIVRAGNDLIAVQGWTPRRPINSSDKAASLYEHNECTRWGSSSTACPSGRIPWAVILPRLKEDDVKPYLAWCPEQSAVYFVGPQGARWIIDPLVVKQLEAQFGKMAVAHSAAVINAIGVAK